MGLKFSYDYRIAEDAAAGIALRDVIYPGGAGLLSWIALALPPSVAALAGAYLVTAAGFSILLAILIVGVSVWIGYLLSDLAHRLSTKRVASLQEKEGMEAVVEFLEEGVRQVSRDGETLLRWRAFHSAFEKDGGVYMVIAGSALVVPARAFPSADARREAMDWIYAHLTPEARARSERR